MSCRLFFLLKGVQGSLHLLDFDVKINLWPIAQAASTGSAEYGSPRHKERRA